MIARDDSRDGVRERPASLFPDNQFFIIEHFYRGTMYRVQVWRKRLDQTTNWAVGLVAVGLAVAYSSPTSSHMVLLLTLYLVWVFLIIEGRRFRYWDIWNRQVRFLEDYLFAPSTDGREVAYQPDWRHHLAMGIQFLHFHLTVWESMGNRLRRNYGMLFAILGPAWLLKLSVHPTPIASWREIFGRAAIGPVPGSMVIWPVVGFYVFLLALALFTTPPEEPVPPRVDGDEDVDLLMPGGLEIFR